MMGGRSTMSRQPKRRHTDQAPADQVPSALYSSRSFTVPAGGTVAVDTTTQVVCVLSLSGASFFTVRLNEGETGLAAAGWQYRAPATDGVRKVELINTEAVPITVFLAFAVGELVWPG